MSGSGSPYLAMLVAMHVATALALVVFFRRDCARIRGGLVSSIRRREVVTGDQRLAWLLVVGMIPVGIAGLLFDKLLRQYLGKPAPAAVFLIIHGAVLIALERL